MSGEKIPDDVMKAAREAARGMGRACGVKWENPTDEQVEPIARAIMAEQERCWEIATDKALQWSRPSKDGTDDGLNACLAVAQDIRRER